MLYFIENSVAITEGLLSQNGLSDLVEFPKHRATQNGPGGVGGIVLKDTRTVAEPRYNPDLQTWSPRFGFPGTYVGVWDDALPTEGQLTRTQQIEGPRLLLLDGSQWMVPRFRQWRADDQAESITYGCKLPQVLTQHPETGILVNGDVVTEYRSLWETSCEIANSILDQASEETTLPEGVVDNFVGDTLRVNYRVGLSEISLLGLLNNSLYRDIVFAAVDWERLQELLGERERRQDSGTPTQASEYGETRQTADTTTPTAQPLVN